jgi:hypothetical protein
VIGKAIHLGGLCGRRRFLRRFQQCPLVIIEAGGAGGVLRFGGKSRNPFGAAQTLFIEP